MPGQRMHKIVVMKLTAVPILPMPETSSPSVQKSVLWPSEKARFGERCIGEPAHVGRVPGAIKPVPSDETEVKKQPSESGEPEAQGIQPRKGHVAGANHQRNQISAEAKYEGHGDEKNHGGAMHGEHAIEHFGRNEMVVRDDELYPHDRRFDAAHDEEEERVEDVENPELLVVDGDDPVVERLADRSSAAGGCIERDCFGSHGYALALVSVMGHRCHRHPSERLEIVGDCVQILSLNCMAGISEPGLIESGF